MSKKNLLIVFAALLLLAVLLYQIPSINARVAWSWERVTTYIRGIINPAGPVPTPKPVTPEPVTPTVSPSPTATGLPTVTPTATPEPLPTQVSLEAPPYELQDMNNCGPATLSMALHVYNWNGDQWTVPLNMAVGKTVMMGKTPVKLQLEVNYYVEKPDAFGPEWMIGLNITPVVPNFIEKWIKGF